MKRMTGAGMVLTLALAGCAQPGQPGYAPPGQIGMNNTTGGTLVGAGTGALIGSQFGRGGGSVAATVVGGLLGAFVGNQIGQRLDQADQADANQAGQQAFAGGAPAQWQNPNNGHYGSVTPQPVYQSNGTYCRNFQETIMIDGQPQNASGTACQQPDGSWQVVSR